MTRNRKNILPIDTKVYKKFAIIGMFFFRGDMFVQVTTLITVRPTCPTMRVFPITSTLSRRYAI